jgi:hypothetical protein
LVQALQTVLLASLGSLALLNASLSSRFSEVSPEVDDALFFAAAIRNAMSPAKGLNAGCGVCVELLESVILDGGHLSCSKSRRDRRRMSCEDGLLIRGRHPEGRCDQLEKGFRDNLTELSRNEFFSVKAADRVEPERLLWC